MSRAISSAVRSNRAASWGAPFLSLSSIPTKSISSERAKASDTWQCLPIFLAAESLIDLTLRVWPILRHRLGGRKAT